MKKIKLDSKQTALLFSLAKKPTSSCCPNTELCTMGSANVGPCMEAGPHLHVYSSNSPSSSKELYGRTHLFDHPYIEDNETAVYIETKLRSLIHVDELYPHIYTALFGKVCNAITLVL